MSDTPKYKATEMEIWRGYARARIAAGGHDSTEYADDLMAEDRARRAPVAVGPSHSADCAIAVNSRHGCSCGADDAELASKLLRLVRHGRFAAIESHDDQPDLFSVGLIDVDDTSSTMSLHMPLDFAVDAALAELEKDNG